MRQSIFGYGILFRALGLVTVLVTLVTCTPAVAPSPVRAGTPKPGEALHLVVLGDFQSFGFGEYYARQIESDLGIKVELDDLTMGGYTPANLLNDLRNGTGSRMGIQRAVKQANVVVFSVAPLDIIKEQENGKLDCSATVLAGYKAALDSIYAETFALRSQGAAHAHSHQGLLLQLLQRLEESWQVRRSHALLGGMERRHSPGSSGP